MKNATDEIGPQQLHAASLARSDGTDKPTRTEQLPDQRDGNADLKTSVFGKALRAEADNFAKGSGYNDLLCPDVLNRLELVGSDKDVLDGFAFGAAVHEKWAKEWDRLPEFMKNRTNESSIVRSWFEEHCEELLKSHLEDDARRVLDHSRRRRCLACLQMMFGNENILSQNDEREFVDRMMNVADTDKFVSFVISKWEATLATLPSYSKADPESTKRLWFVQSWRDMLSDYATLTSDHKSVSDEQSARATLEALQTFVGSLATDSKVAADICQYVSSTTPNLSMDDIEHMKGSVTKEWRKAWDDLPAMAKFPDEHICRSGWFELEYKSLLTKTAKSTSDTVPSRFWSKILSLAAKDDLSQENHVKALIKKATEADFQTFCAVVESSWNAEWERLPEFAKKDQELKKVLWFRQCYVKLVEMAFATKTASVSQQDADTIPSRFWSKISSLAAKDDLSQEDQVKDLTKKATNADFQTFCEIVESSWNAEWGRLPEFAKKDPDIKKHLWFREHYVQLVEKALTSKLAHGQEAAANMAGIAGLNQKSNMGSNAMNMFSSPVKRQRRSGTQASTQSPLVEMTAADIHKKDILSTERHSFVGFLLDVPEEDRTVKVYNKREKAEEDVSVLTCLFADVTGPALFDLWRESVQTFRNTVSQNSSNTNLLLFKITDFTVRSMSSKNRACYPGL